MFSQLQVMIVAAMLLVFLGAGFYVKTLNDQVVRCEANTDMQKDKYDIRIENYDENIKDIGAFFTERTKEVDTFERTSDETDCQASKRFFDRANY